MNLWHLVTREIHYKKIGFILGVLSVCVAVGVLVAQLTLLDAHDLETQRILKQKEEQTLEDMRLMEDDYRKIMKGLGFNLLILPRGQRLDNYYAEGYARKDMPEEFVARLSESRMMTIRHLLPSLEQKVTWPEAGDRTIILIGTRGEVPFLHRDPKEPILTAVTPGSMVLGYELWKNLGVKGGDMVTLLGKQFRAEKLHPQRGSKDDITIWIDLKEAQELLGKKGRINAILALKCLCPGSDLKSLRKEIGKILPETHIIEFENKALTRALARERAKAVADSAISAEKKYRSRLRNEKEIFASWLVPLVLIGCIVWVGMLALSNVRERRTEIGILRAMGLRSGQVIFIFLSKALLLGFVGAFMGFIAGFAMGAISGNLRIISPTAFSLFNPLLFIGVLLAAPLLSAAASWLPALIAAGEDPAEILREE